MHRIAFFFWWLRCCWMQSRLVNTAENQQPWIFSWSDSSQRAFSKRRCSTSKGRSAPMCRASLCASASGSISWHTNWNNLAQPCFPEFGGLFFFLSSSHFCSRGWSPRLEKSAECFRQTYLPGCWGFVETLHLDLSQYRLILAGTSKGISLRSSIQGVYFQSLNLSRHMFF